MKLTNYQIREIANERVKYDMPLSIVLTNNTDSEIFNIKILGHSDNEIPGVEISYEPSMFTYKEFVSRIHSNKEPIFTNKFKILCRKNGSLYDDGSIIDTSFLKKEITHSVKTSATSQFDPNIPNGQGVSQIILPYLIDLTKTEINISKLLANSVIKIRMYPITEIPKGIFKDWVYELIRGIKSKFIITRLKYKYS